MVIIPLEVGIPRAAGGSGSGSGVRTYVTSTVMSIGQQEREDHAAQPNAASPALR
jgi:hypothetical protein